MSNADISSSSWSLANEQKSHRKGSHPESSHAANLVPKQEPVEEYSTQSENDLVLRKIKSASTSFNRSRRRSLQIPQDHSFTLLELSDKDIGYDADIEVVQPSAYDEPETDTETPNVNSRPSSKAGGAAQLTDRLKDLQIRNRTRQRKSKHAPTRMTTSSPLPRTHKRGFSESFESESDYEVSELGNSDLGSPHGAKRSRKGHRKSASSLASIPVDHDRDRWISRAGARETSQFEEVEAASLGQDSMDVDG